MAKCCEACETDPTFARIAFRCVPRKACTARRFAAFASFAGRANRRFVLIGLLESGREFRPARLMRPTTLRLRSTGASPRMRGVPMFVITMRSRFRDLTQRRGVAPDR